MTTAKNRIIKLLRNDLSFENVEKVLNERGYSVVFFNTRSGDVEIDRYDLGSEKSTLMAFTYLQTARIVFIDGTLSAEDKLYLALHELGHIILGHLDSDIFNRNKILLDIEADNFAYTVIHGKNKSPLYITVAAMLSLSLLFCATFIVKNNDETTTAPLKATEMYNQTTEGETVYITTSGTKFHRTDCMYIKNKTLIELSRDEAYAKYVPCSACRP